MAKEEKKAAPARQQPNFFQRTWDRIRQYFRETIGELRKVSWPTRREATYLTGVVLVVTLAMALLFGVILDNIYTAIFRFLLSI